MKNGPKIAIVVICLLVAAGLVLYNAGIIGGKAPATPGGASQTTSTPEQAAAAASKPGAEDSGTNYTKPQRAR